MRLKRYKHISYGFTLAELLVVVAIIAILVAVSIPIFSGQIEKAREATDVANMRAAAAAAVQFYYDENLQYVRDNSAANAIGLNWYQDGNSEECNVFGVYDINSGTFKHWDDITAYGKGTPKDAGIEYEGYDCKADYRNAAINVAFHVKAKQPFIRMAWKTKGLSVNKRPFVRRQGAKDFEKWVIYIQ